MEIAFILRRILIIATVSFWHNSANQEFIVTLILFAYFIFFLVFPPYHNKTEVNAEIFVTATLIILISTGSFHQFTDSFWTNFFGLAIYLICFVYLFFALITKIRLPSCLCNKFRRRYFAQ